MHPLPSGWEAYVSCSVRHKTYRTLSRFEETRCHDYENPEGTSYFYATSPMKPGSESAWSSFNTHSSTLQKHPSRELHPFHGKDYLLSCILRFFRSCFIYKKKLILQSENLFLTGLTISHSRNRSRCQWLLSTFSNGATWVMFYEWVTPTRHYDALRLNIPGWQDCITTMRPGPTLPLCHAVWAS